MTVNGARFFVVALSGSRKKAHFAIHLATTRNVSH